MTAPPPAAEPATPSPGPHPGLGELFVVSLGLGLVGFGGGYSVLALIHANAVTRRRWLTEVEFNNAATIAQMLPGGAAANMLAAVGLRFRGIAGAAAAYLGFVVPGAAAITALALVYVRFGAIPHADTFLAGLNAAVVGIILSISVKMARSGIGRRWQMGMAASALLLATIGGAGSLEVAFLGIAAGLGWDLGVERARLLRFGPKRWRPAPPVALPEEGEPLPRAPRPGAEGEAEAKPIPPARLLAVAWPAWALLVLPAVARLLPLAVVCFKTGLGAYGGGFAIIPALHHDVVLSGWLTERQFADAVAVGKLTPGPVLLMATFIGYLREGLAGSLVATASILAAPFLLVVLLSSWLERVQSQPWMRAALSGLTPAVVGLMVAAAMTLGQTIRAGAGIGIAAAVALTLVRFEEVNPVALLAIAGAARVVLNVAFGV